MTTSALSSVVTHTVALPENPVVPALPGAKSTLTLGLVPALAPYLGAVPDSEPPFDARARAPRTRSLPTARTAIRHRPESRLISPSGSTLSAIPAAPAEVRDHNVPGWSCEADSGITRTAALDLPPSRTASHMLARAVIEVIFGYRQLAQLRIHCAPEVFAGIGQQIRVGGPPPTLMSVRATEPADGVVEASAVFRRRNRAAAMAFRLQGIDGRWRITALQIG